MKCAHGMPFGAECRDGATRFRLWAPSCGRVGLELGHIHPRPPAVRVFDAGMGDGTVLARVMREMHRRFPTVPFCIVGKEISARWPTASSSIPPPCWW